MKTRFAFLTAVGLAVILAPQPAAPQFLGKVLEALKPPPFPFGGARQPDPAVAPAALEVAGPPPPPPAPPRPGEGWITPDPETIWVIDTSKGRVLVELSSLVARDYVDRIKRLTRGGFYDGRKFFRVIDEFMAQTGDPEENGEGASALPDIKGEFSFRRKATTSFTAVASSRSFAGLIGTLPIRSQPDAQMAFNADGGVNATYMFCAGVVGMARAEEPDSANSQFFIMRQTYPTLDGNYTAFGRVLSGLSVVRSIKVGEPPDEPMDTMVKVRILADIPPAERPKIQVMDTAAQPFRDYAAAWRASQGAEVDICKLDIPVVVE